ncbi:MAG: hypothetical protein AUK24_03500 [Syntrophaceae bacterium CG2_30_49_12]|nr:MAG: hypothetical protein AUK24_03500 [Syntrophaceae bacterium CG2_30_49_12]PIP07521.1 MAG: hypothetical protein COX52_03420 [Syntrophobacterales bacterium CG23_combo_of_CG06-09_8_20_14_all_48_27]PJC73599.1 MAG: hypothetical protein CO012_08785 [Syntrophobacterales bacterium CG_4_8_14_3_um_filter_49_14]
MNGRCPSFSSQQFCYYLITKCRGSPVVEQVLGILFEGILICDFWGAYNKTAALAKEPKHRLSLCRYSVLQNSRETIP